MSDELDALLDLRIRHAFHTAALPSAPSSLRDALDDLPNTVLPRRPSPGRSSSRSAVMGAVAAGFLFVAVIAWSAMTRQGGFGPANEATPTPIPTPSPSPSASSSPAPGSASSSYTAYSVTQLLAGRADGSVGGEGVILYGWYSDLRGLPEDACSPQVSTTIELTCLDRRQGMVDADRSVGMVTDGRWEPTTDPVVHPYWPAGLPNTQPVSGFLAAIGSDRITARPIFVLLIGHFDDARADACPAEAAPPCADQFVVEDIVQFDNPAAIASPVPSGTPFPFDSPPPPPAQMANCTKPRSQEAPWPGDPVDPPLASEGWVRKTDVPFEFVGAELAPDVVYFGIVEGAFPLGIWLDDPNGSGRFRWWGTAACVADANAIWFSWLPGTTYRLYENGRRVDGGDPFDPLPTATPRP